MARTQERKRVVGNPGNLAFVFGGAKREAPSGGGHGRRQKGNSGHINGYTLVTNPCRKVTMAQTKKKKKSSHKPKGYASHSKSKHNPGHMKGHRRGNPGGTRIRGLVPTAAFAIVG